ncbi:phosphoribosyltransferase family protein [Streptomyces roseicoloratus]|uniref:Orotate phosphoribosyltransferase n=1 Tax=Streptomyces roseicoloratus TaxID=2508722 RepID=A0ABY9RX27_9ACTN|nr:phosphoribosyltransferase family protein [Streptomyces roseicoloratus]WMX46243.1 phosphoribosyltransferase family protein [Streptomyces roseicoloratus]
MTTHIRLTDLTVRLAETSLVTAPFHLADGARLDSYFDEYRLAADPDLLRDTAAAMAALVPDETQLLAGIELGGVPLAVALSAATGLPAVFLRRRPKGYGSRRQIEGAAFTGRRTVLVDDVVRSGGQLLAMARILRIAGAPVSDALCVLERPLGGRTLLAEHNVTLRSLLTEADLSEASRRGDPL